jgi:hypothetical protein
MPTDSFAPEQAPDLRPAPHDSVNTTIPTKHGTFAYWVLRVNGDCLLVRPLSRIPTSLKVVANELVESVAETLLNFRRLYANLDVTPRADLRIDIRLMASTSSTLFVPASVYGGLHEKKRTDLQHVSHREDLVLGRIDHDLVAITRRFAEPLINAFEGYHLPDEIYEQIVNRLLASVS